VIHTVDLQPHHLKDIYQEGVAREDRHPTDGSYDGLDGYDANIMGLKGEFAFADFYGLEPDLSAQIDGDGGVDFEISCWLGDSLTVDVKTTEHDDDPWLRVPVDKDDWADMYVCAAENGATIDLIGWQSREEIKSFPASNATKKQTNHILKQDDLRQLPNESMITAVDADTAESQPTQEQGQGQGEQGDETQAHTIPRSPPSEFARRTHDTEDEYAKPRIKNTTQAVYLEAIREREMSRDNPRQQRIEWMDQQETEITE
jgi:hypothetical protein